MALAATLARDRRDARRAHARERSFRTARPRVGAGRVARDDGRSNARAAAAATSAVEATRRRDGARRGIDGASIPKCR